MVTAQALPKTGTNSTRIHTDEPATSPATSTRGGTRGGRVLTGFLSLSAYIRMIRVDPCSIYDWLSSYVEGI